MTSRVSAAIVIVVLVVAGIRVLDGTWQRVSCGANLSAATVLSVQHLGAQPALGECFMIALNNQAGNAPTLSVPTSPIETEPASSPEPSDQEYVEPGDATGCHDYAGLATKSDSTEQQVFDECMQYGAP